MILFSPRARDNNTFKFIFVMRQRNEFGYFQSFFRVSHTFYILFVDETAIDNKLVNDLGSKFLPYQINYYVNY